ncbi:MAG: SRPBCC domain-containing protein [Hyphomicrobiales bacterium]|nr:SRPBCC domain-containing protein [Hyphomicrobiales bacterium]
MEHGQRGAIRTGHGTVRFDSRGSATEVVVRHERIRDPETLRTHGLGWEGCLDGLKAYAEA